MSKVHASHPIKLLHVSFVGSSLQYSTVRTSRMGEHRDLFYHSSLSPIFGSCLPNDQPRPLSCFLISPLTHSPSNFGNLPTSGRRSGEKAWNKVRRRQLLHACMLAHGEAWSRSVGIISWKGVSVVFYLLDCSRGDQIEKDMCVLPVCS